MGFFSGLLDFAKQAIPGVIGYAIGGPAGAAVGGALGGAAFGDEPLQDALIGGALGYAGGSALQSAGGFGGLTGSLSKLLSGSSLSGLTGGSPLLSLLNLGGNLFSGLSGQNAAKTASSQLQKAGQTAINAQKSQISANNLNAQPYLGAGSAAATGLTNLADPQAQAAFIQNNPFYQALANDAKDKLFANAAASGKLGSGGTAEALQNSLLLIGQNLLNQNIQNLQGTATIGANTATSLNNTNQTGTNNLTGLITDQGSAKAAGTIGSNNALTGSIDSFLKTQSQIAGLSL